ncbi:MAG: hypothetical protein KGH93_00830 [Patescibacteria group bacterium]|nr:hypothetical protein [Patescibacteria group bacterium]
MQHDREEQAVRIENLQLGDPHFEKYLGLMVNEPEFRALQPAASVAETKTLVLKAKTYAVQAELFIQRELG